MKTTIEKSFQVSYPIDKVWDYLSNPHKIIPCVPGAALTETIDDRNFKGEVSMKFGPVKAKYAGQITFVDVDTANYKMVMSGKGLDSKGKGSADMMMNGILTEKEGQTDVACSMELTITGMLAQFGSRLITDVSGTIFEQFVNNFKNALAGKEVDNTISVGKVVKGMISKR